MLQTERGGGREGDAFEARTMRARTRAPEASRARVKVTGSMLPEARAARHKRELRAKEKRAAMVKGNPGTLSRAPGALPRALRGCGRIEAT